MNGPSVRHGGRTALNALLRGWMLIAGTAIIFAAGGLAYCLLQKPTYEATSVIYVTSGTIASTSSYDSMKASQERVVTYAQLIYTNAVLAAAIKAAGVDMSIDSVRSAVRVEINPQITMMTISATDHNPETAQKLASGVAQGLTRATSRLDQPPGGGASTSRISTVTPATVGSRPIAPNTPMIVGLILIVGLIVGTLAVVARERLNNKVRDEADAAAAAGAPVLAVISESAERAEGDGAFRTLRADLLTSGAHAPVRSVLITSAVTSANQPASVHKLAKALASAGGPVAVVDAWLERGAPARVGAAVGTASGSVDRQPSLARFLLNGEGPPGQLEETSTPGVFMLPATMDGDELADGGTDPAPMLATPKFRRLVERLGEEYSFIVIDAPPVLAGGETVAMASVADRAICVADAGVSRISDLRECGDRFTELGVQLSGIVLFGSGKQR